MNQREHIVHDATPVRRHIIERPRLTRLLDQTGASVITLVAPAGYGKTTLAQQWLRETLHIWYQATPASADLAALVLGLAKAAEPHAPKASARVHERLAASGEPTEAVEALGEILAEEFDEYPPGTILSIDDYHLITQSPIAEDLIFNSLSNSSLRLLVGSRSRPRWATAKRVLYGEVFELGRTLLAMTPEEAEKVLAVRQAVVPPGLATLAQGWPAVLGLAALTADTPPAEEVPDALYDFFAEELYQTVGEPTREHLTQLALLESFDARMLDVLFGDESAEVLATGIQIGFLTRQPNGQVTAHPLVQSFLEKKLAVESEEIMRIAEETARLLIRDCRWDNAFSIIKRFSLFHLLEFLVSRSLLTMIRDGRLATLEQWISAARSASITAPVLDLAEAEVAYRRAAYELAETLALRAAERLLMKHKLRSRAYIVAGHSAHLSDREEAGLDYHTSALLAARDEADRREASWGRLICGNQLGLPEVTEIMRDLEGSRTASPTERLRLATMRLVVGLRAEGISDGLRSLRSAHELVQSAPDPLARTAFLNAYARALSLAAFYDEACVVADELMEDAHRYRLEFVFPHAFIARAIGELGARREATALGCLEEAEDRAVALNDPHNLVNAQAVRCRVFCTTGAFGEALASTASALPAPSAVVQGEFMVSRALALLGAGRGEEATALARYSETCAPSHEIHGLAKWIPVIASSPDNASALESAFAFAEETGVFDGFVVSSRAFPSLLQDVSVFPELLDRARPILLRAGDEQRMPTGGPRVSTPLAQLSRREREVHELVVAGRTNKEIASTLFISEVTVKVHVRHILRKLGARSRTEAAVIGATKRGQ